MLPVRFWRNNMEYDMNNPDFYKLLDAVENVIKEAGLEYCNPAPGCPCVTTRTCRYLVYLNAGMKLCERKNYEGK